MSKATTTTTKPSECLKRISELYHQYAERDSGDPGNFKLVNQTFVIQSDLDIQRNLQKLEGMYRMLISQLVEMAFKVFTSWDKAQDGKEHRKMKQQPSHLAEVLLGELEAKKKKKKESFQR